MSHQLIVKLGPVNPVGQDDEFVLHVDDLIQAGLKKVVVARLRLLLRSHIIPHKPRHQGNHKRARKHI